MEYGGQICTNCQGKGCNDEEQFTVIDNQTITVKVPVTCYGCEGRRMVFGQSQ